MLGVKTDAKKIAYACSTISYEQSKKYENIFKKMERYLQEFSFISMREKSGIDILMQYTNIPIKHVLDPTLLLSRSQWERVRKNGKKRKKRYLFCYFLGNANVSAYKKNIASVMKKHNLEEVVLIELYHFIQDTHYCYDDNAGPREWLDLIADAGAVLTDSFHGMVFSIIFKKEFYYMERSMSNGNFPFSNPDRVQGMLELMHLSDRKITKIDDIFQCSEVDWKNVMAIWKEKRIESIAFLKNSLS